MEGRVGASGGIALGLGPDRGSTRLAPKLRSRTKVPPAWMAQALRMDSWVYLAWLPQTHGRGPRSEEFDQCITNS